MRIINCIIIFLLFSACSSHVRIDPYGCPGTVSILEMTKEEKQYKKLYSPLDIAKMKKNRDFLIKTRIWTPLGDLKVSEVQTKEILRDHNIECSKVDQIDFALSSDVLDIVLSAIPFLSTKTLIISGNVRPETKYNFLKDERPIND